MAKTPSNGSIFGLPTVPAQVSSDVSKPVSTREGRPALSLEFGGFKKERHLIRNIVIGLLAIGGLATFYKLKGEDMWNEYRLSELITTTSKECVCLPTVGSTEDGGPGLDINGDGKAEKAVEHLPKSGLDNAKIRKILVPNEKQ